MTNTETLLQAYTPLILWVGLGLVLFRFLPDALPRLLGRILYWFGVPLEILALARRTDFSAGIGLASGVMALALGVGLVLAGSSLLLGKRLEQAASPEGLGRLQQPSCQGSFLLSAMIGNTGFIGLAIAPLLVSDRALNLVVFYSVTHNIIGTYGLGVFLASYFGRSVGTAGRQKQEEEGETNINSATAPSPLTALNPSQNRWWIQIRDVLTVPTLWAFILGYLTRSLALPTVIESGLQASLWFVIPAAFLLMGIRLGQIQGWSSLRLALVPACIKVVALPGLVGIGTTLAGLPTASRLALVLMSGMPTAFAGLILAEEYDLDREIIASSILLSSVTLLLMIPLWSTVFDG
jgi:hypothetical protein